MSADWRLLPWTKGLTLAESRGSINAPIEKLRREGGGGLTPTLTGLTLTLTGLTLTLTGLTPTLTGLTLTLTGL